MWGPHPALAESRVLPAQAAPFGCTYIEWYDDLVAIVPGPTKAFIQIT